MAKKVAVALAMAGIAVSASVAWAGTGPGTGLNGSKHDLNAVAGYAHDTFYRTCVFCHTPHNARATTISSSGEVVNSDKLTPLWNHADNVTPFIGQPYTWVSPANGNNNAIPIATDPLIGPSRLCMACHDGDTAVDSHGSAGYTQGATTKMKDTTSSWYVDSLNQKNTRYITDLTVTHPIGFSYDLARTTRGAKELVPSSFGFLMSAPCGTAAANWNTQNRYDTGGAPVSSLTLSIKKISDTLYNGYMTCATCHDVHNSVNAVPQDAGTGSYNYFLYAPEEGSAICLSCHIK